MKMKNLFFVGLALSLVLASCDNMRKAPEQIQATFKTIYPDVSRVEWDDEDDGSWEAEFRKDGVKTKAYFAADATLIETEEEITSKDLPQAAQDYFAQNYPGARVKDVLRITDADGIQSYEAEANDQDFYFDAQGNLFQRAAGKTAATANAPVENEDIPIDQLPATVSSFIAEHYAAYSIESADYDKFCTGEMAIDVDVKKQGLPDMSLYFTPEGEFIQQKEKLTYADLPAAVKDAVKAKYPDYAVGRKADHITLADKTIQYEIDLEKGDLSIEALFDATGAYICEK